ncbi:hypothetical protein [Aliiroseovarius marinus]|uniref:hypothetical protein n=1 Tax=Aliiroseovarius marinus TaxID=2500159 RepID=UPI0010604675|nr:hypothetical protein [Aliiroseovarius marinus]
MKQDISINRARSLLVRHPVVSRGVFGTSAIAHMKSIHQKECVVPPTPRTRQNGFKVDLQTEGAKRKIDARLHVKESFDAFGPDPAVAPAKIAQNMGAAGLADHTPIRLCMPPENSV